jgi:hypothetical protein
MNDLNWGKNLRNYNMSKRTNKQILDRFHYHEAMDRTYMIQSNVETFLVEHPVYDANKKLRKKADKVSTLLAELYLEISAEEYNKFK